MQPIETSLQRFHLQRPNEIVLLETRRHWWAWVRWLPISALMVAAGVGAALLLPTFGGIFIVLGIVFALAFGLYLYADWINDSIFVTDQRIVRITRNLLRFSLQVNEIPLASIQEINADIPNWDLFALAFHYGYIAFRTSGAAGDVKLNMIPDPDKVQDLILMDMRQFRARQTAQNPDDMRRAIERMITPGNAVEAFAAPPRATTVGPVRAPWSPFVHMYPVENGAIVFRHHWYKWVKMVSLPIVTMIGSVVLLVVLLAMGLGVIGGLLSAALFVIGVAWFLWQDADFRNDYMIVTNNTITLMHQRPLWLQNERDVLLLKRVDNIIAEKQGLINQLLNKGTLRFALIGGNEYKTFADIYNPLGVQAELTRRQSLARQQAAEEQQMQQQAVIAQYIQAYHEMMEQRGLIAPTQQPSPMPSAANVPPSPMPSASPRPAFSEGRPYQPYIPNQPPPYQMPPTTGPTVPMPPVSAAPPSVPVPPLAPAPMMPPSAPSPQRAPEDAPPPPPLFPRPPQP